jgi:anaerobic selenocysteine-containing dehydrogenase
MAISRRSKRVPWKTAAHLGRRTQNVRTRSRRPQPMRGSIARVQLKTVCNRDCPDACGIVATVENGEVTRIAGDRDHPVTKGFLCYRTSQFLATQRSPQRLTSPLLRKHGELTKVSWDEALDFAAAELERIKRESGPAAIFHYRSGGSLGHLKLLTERFFEQYGPCTAKRGDICSGGGDAAQLTDFGVEDSSDLFDLLNAKNILLWGKNVHVSSPHTLPVLIDARRKGSRLVLIDPVRHRTADSCERYLQVRPGADFALAMATARVLFERGWTDPKAHEYCDHLDAFRALAFSRSVDDWCKEAELPPSDAEDLARRLGPEKPCAILVGWGLQRRSGGSATVRALDALGAVSGNLGIEGGGVSFYFARRMGFDMGFKSGAAPRTVCEITFAQDLEAAKEPPIRAVWITCGNPVAMLPDSNGVARALGSRELTVVVDSFLTDTAKLATLVLPTTTLLEADDVVGAYGHHYLGSARPVVAPPQGVKSDLEIIQQLAERVGLKDVMAGTAREWKQRMMRPGTTLESIESGYVRNAHAPKVLFKDRRFPTASGKVNLITQAPQPEAAVTPRFPLKLMALSTEKAQSSQWAHPPAGQAEVTVHPEAAAGVKDGGRARLESELGALEVVVRHDARQRRDVALMAKGGHLGAGRCANALTRARLTDAGEGAALYEEHVRLVP